MNYGWTAATWAAIGVGVAAASAVDQSQKASYANRMAKDNALKTQQAQDEATNRANAKTPDVAAMLSANLLAGKAGSSGTMLTGPQGLDASQLTLGKNTLLGG